MSYACGTFADIGSDTRLMVSRVMPAAPGPNGPDGRRARLTDRLFLAWRMVVTRTLHGARDALSFARSSQPVLAAVVVGRYLRAPGATLASADETQRSRLKEAGAAAVVVGVALSFLIPVAIGEPPLRRFLAAGSTAAWALARLFVMRTVARGTLAERPTLVDDAWGPALLPYAVAVAAPLGFVALAVSAWMTATGLAAVGATPRESRRVVAWAFGGQVAVESAAWLARGGVVALLALAS